MAVAAVSLGLAACGNSEAGGGTPSSSASDSSQYPKSTFGGLKGSLTWYDTSGGLPTEAKKETIWKDFTDVTGLPVKEEYTDGTIAKLRAAEENGNVPWNLIEFGSGGDFFKAQADGILQPLDTKKVPVDRLDPSAVEPSGIRVQDYGLVLVWNKKALGGATPTKTTDVFDTKKFPGKRCLQNYPVGGEVLEVARLADGVKPADMYPIDVDKALAKLATIKNDVVWWESGATVIQNLANGDCSMGLVYSGRVYDAIVNQKLPFGFTWNGGMTTSSYLGVPKGAPNPEVGQAAIAMWILDHQGQVNYVNKTTYPSAIKGLTLDDFDPKVRPYVASGKNVANVVHEDAQYYAKNLDTVVKQFTDFTSSK